MSISHLYSSFIFVISKTNKQNVTDLNRNMYTI